MAVATTCRRLRLLPPASQKRRSTQPTTRTRSPSGQAGGARDLPAPGLAWSPAGAAGRRRAHRHGQAVHALAVGPPHDHLQGDQVVT